jgi:hypothetical protein
MNVALCTLNDVETELRQSVPNNLVSFAQRHIESTSDVLRMAFRREGKDLDWRINGDDTVVPPIKPDELLKRVARDTVARSVANDVSTRMNAVGDDGSDLSAFSQFSEGAGGYTFSGTFAGTQQDIWISDQNLKQLGLKRPRAARVELE